MAQVVPDPEFNNPAEWIFYGTGATVTGGQLRFINPNIISSDTVPDIVARVGEVYPYSFELSAAIGSFLTARILFGGVEIYNNGMVLGRHRGTVTPINTNGLVFLMQGAGQRVFNSLTIGKKRRGLVSLANQINARERAIRKRRNEQIMNSLIKEERIIRYL